MQEIRVKKANFLFEQFVDEILKFLRTQVSQEVDPSFAIVSVRNPGDVPTFGPEAGGRDFMEELTRDGLSLFFPFSSSDVGEPIPCADGKTRTIKEDSEFGLGDTDCVGFLVSLRNGEFVINSAVHGGGGCPVPPPSIDLASDCDVFDKPMRKFIKTYVAN